MLLSIFYTLILVISFISLIEYSKKRAHESYIQLKDRSIDHSEFEFKIVLFDTL
jgi:hypothetical protein